MLSTNNMADGRFGESAMSVRRFDGRTAIVTGAGGNPGLGRAHALLLGALGANVVVNDIGRDTAVPGYKDSASAEVVAEEIRQKGGRAVADCHSVANEADAGALVDAALVNFGSVDIVVNNAGISIAAPFDEMTSEDFQRHIDINLMGPLWVCRAAWPYMKANRYGRIVNTTSGALTGVKRLTAYGASKGGLLALTRALAAEGESFGIKVNAVNPGAYTRMVAAQQEETSAMLNYARDHLRPEQVSPVVALLAHEDCPVTGECIEAVGGEVRRLLLAQNRGIADPDLTVETVLAQWQVVMSDMVDAILPYGAFDPDDWDFKPYHR